MKKIFTLLSILVVISLCSTVLAFDGGPPPGTLGQLPASKEMLLHQTMREVFDATKDIREQIKGLEAEIKTICTATEAVRELAKKFNQGERKVLAEYLRQPPPPPPHKGGPPPKPGPPPS